MNIEIDKIYNLDCYKAIKDIPDKSIDCIYTDIPYEFNCGEANKNSSPLTYRTKILRNIDLKEMRKGIDYSIFDDFIRVMKKINCFIWCSKLQIFDIMKFFLEKLKQDEKYKDKYQNIDINYEILTWNKENPTPLTNNTWLPDIEYCLYFRESGVKLNDGYENKSKWYISPINKKDKDKFAHPTIKPLELVKRHLLHTTQPNDIVLDCFLGSGTTTVACKEIGRHYIGFEIDKKWFDIAQNRLNKIDANGQLSMFLN